MTEILAPIVNFSLVAGLLIWKTKKPVAEFFATRSKDVAKEIEEAKTLAAESTTERAEWESKWNGRTQEVARFREDAARTLTRAQEQANQYAQTEAQRIQKEAQLMSQSEASQAKLNLGREVIDQSISLARGYLRENLDEKDQHRLVAEYAELVENGSPR